MRRVKPPKELNYIRALGWTPETHDENGLHRALRDDYRTEWRRWWWEVLYDIMALKPRRPVRVNTDYADKPK